MKQFKDVDEEIIDFTEDAAPETAGTPVAIKEHRPMLVIVDEAKKAYVEAMYAQLQNGEATLPAGFPDGKCALAKFEDSIFKYMPKYTAAVDREAAKKSITIDDMLNFLSDPDISVAGANGLSLTVLAKMLDKPRINLYQVAKKPIQGEVFGKGSINYFALEKYIEKRVEDFEEFIYCVVAGSFDAVSSDRRKGSAVSSANKKIVGVNGQSVPVRSVDLKVGDHIRLMRKGADAATEWEVIGLTPSHIALKATTAAESGAQELLAFSNWTFGHQFKGLVITGDEA